MQRFSAASCVLGKVVQWPPHDGCRGRGRVAPTPLLVCRMPCAVRARETQAGRPSSQAASAGCCKNIRISNVFLGCRRCHAQRTACNDGPHDATARASAAAGRRPRRDRARAPAQSPAPGGRRCAGPGGGGFRRGIDGKPLVFKGIIFIPSMKIFHCVFHCFCSCRRRSKSCRCRIAETY